MFTKSVLHVHVHEVLHDDNDIGIASFILWGGGGGGCYVKANLTLYLYRNTEEGGYFLQVEPDIISYSLNGAGLCV